MLLTQISTQQISKDVLSLLDLASKGGILMIPIGFLSVLAIYLFCERWLVLRKSSRNPENFLKKVKTFVMEGNLQEAQNLCSKTKTPFARMVSKGLTRLGSPLNNIENSIEYVAKLEIYRLEKGLSILATIGNAAPMLGFLGTVIGMVETFMVISSQQGVVSVNPQQLASGIYVAMITTVAGLIVGIIANVGYNYLVTRVQKIIYQMQYTVMDFLDLLQEPRN